MRCKASIRRTATLLWQKVPAEMWADSLDEKRTPQPFLPPGYELLEPSDRNVVLANGLMIPINTLHQRWKRWRPLLLELRFVQELKEAG